MMRFFVDTDGKFIGGFDGAAPPEGAIEVPTGPFESAVRERWDGAAWVAVPGDPPKLYVPKLTIVDRLIEAGKLVEGLAAIAADPLVQARWNAAVEIAADDPTAIALVTALGLDPAAVLAP